MTVNSHLSTFLNKRVEDYSPEIGIRDPLQVVYRIKLEYDESEAGTAITDKIAAFAKDPKAAEVKEIIIGAFDFESSDSTEGIVAKLVALKDTFKSLKALFIGDITYEESEISWIKQSDVSPVLKAYPNLEHFQVRGADGLAVGDLQHDNLKTLIIETGGMPPEIIAAVAAAKLPRLEKLELWLGDENYGFSTSSVRDIDRIISGGNFPALKHLGLMDSVIQDEIAIAVAQTPLLKQLKSLDLSMGTLSDIGAESLLKSEGIKGLESLNLRHHFLSDGMMERLKKLGIAVNLDDQEKEEEEDDRYIEVSE